MAITRLNSLAIPAGTVVSADLTYPLTTFSSTGIDDNATSTAITIDSSENVGIGDTSPSRLVHMTKTSGDSILRLENTGNGNLSGIEFYRESSAGTSKGAGGISVTSDTSSSATALNFIVGSNTGITGSPTVDMTITSAGNVGIGTTSPSHNLDVTSSTASTDVSMRVGPTASTGDNDGTLIINNGGTGDAMLRFDYEGNTDRARIGVTTSGQHLGFYTAGANERMRIDSSGNVGIGTSSPSSLLSLEASNAELSFTDTSRLSKIFTQNGGRDLQIQANQDLIINASGGSNVGIGTSSPSDELEVYASNDTARIRASGPGNASNGAQFGMAGTVDAVLTNTENGVFIFGTNNTERMRIDASGNVGIGTSSPNVPLTVQANSSASAVRFFGRSSDNISTLGFIANNGVTAQGYVQGRSDSLRVWAASGDYLNLGSNDTEAARIDASGNFLVGATSASAKLQVDHSSASTPTALFLNQSTASSGVGAVQTSIPSQSNNTNCFHFKGTTQGVASYFLYGNGTSSFTSDERQKKNIVNTRDGYLDDLKRLRVVDYHWNNQEDTEDKSVGLIAQEVEQVFPHLVIEHEMEGVGLRKNLRGSEFTFVLIKAIQEQQAMIETLQAEVAALKGA